jgi:hypothetical protein
LFTMNQGISQHSPTRAQTGVLGSRHSKMNRIKADAGIDFKLLEKSAYKLNSLLSDKKAKKMNFVKTKLVDYDIFDMDNEAVKDILARDTKHSRPNFGAIIMREEEASRKNVYMEW